MQQNSSQPYANVPYHQVQPINQQVVVQPVRVQPVHIQPVRVQQVVVTNTPLVQQGSHSEPFVYKQHPCFFWSLLIGSILSGIYVFVIGSYVVGVLALLIGVPMSFTLRELTIRAEDKQIFIGWGPLRCFACCLQEITVPYANIISYGEYTNQCWYPLGYHPAFFDPNGDCCINWFFRGCCCCTNAFFYNAACIFCFFVLQAPQLIVLRLRAPVTCGCHTLNHIAISLPDSKPLRDFLHSKGLRHDFTNVSGVRQTVVSVQQQQYAPVQQVQQVQQVQAVQSVQQPIQNQVQLQQMHNEPLIQSQEGYIGEVYAEHLQQSQM